MGMGMDVKLHPRQVSPENEPSAPSSETCPLCGGLGYIKLDVPVGHPSFGKLFPCRCRLAAMERRRAAQLRAMSNLEGLERYTFETFVPGGFGLDPFRQKNLRDAYESARQFAQSPQGWLVLLGGYGCGKTHLAAAIANYRVEQGYPALFVNVPDLLDHLRAAFSPTSEVGYDERFEMVRTAPLLILDDLGTENATPWAQEKLYQIFNYRYNTRLPTVITSNHRLEEIPPRLRSRMLDPDLCRIHTILAPDFRHGGGSGMGESELSSLALHQDQTFESFEMRPELSGEEQDNLKRALAEARRFAEEPTGWLVFQGTYGCGKTHLAAAIANYRVQQGDQVLFVTVPDLLDHLRATFNPQSPIPYDKRFEEVRTAPLLVLDDLGTQSATSWAREKLHQLLDYRYNARLPTVITTANTLEELDPRLRSRMLDGSRCTVFAIVAPPYWHGGKGQRKAKTTRSRRRSRKT